MALFKTTSELQKYINIDVNLKFTRIASAIDSAESDFIVHLLGKEQYDELLQAYNNATTESPISGPLANLLPYVQKALANYAAFLSVEELGVSVGDAGIQQQFSQNSQPAPAWKVKDLKMKYLTAGDKAADSLLEFLEVSAVIPEDGSEEDRVYRKWYDSSANTSLSGCVVYKTSIANKYIDINDSRRLFLRLKKRIREIEASYLLSVLCSDQYAEMVEQLKDNNLSDENKELIQYLEPIIAKRALHATLPMLPVIITADGLFLQTSNDTVIQKLQAGQSEINALMHQLKDGEHIGFVEDERKLQDFLNKNIDNYPLIKNSNCYSGRVVATDERWKIDNHPHNKHFSV